jgi:diguanylate cyclase (GGDEF)-like protein/PAS domain S-box-containing protein
MAENIDEVFFLRDADGKRMLYVSPAYEEVWGRTCESLYASPASWSETVHPEDRASADERSKRGLLAERFNLEYRIVRPDGSIRWIESRGFPVRDDTGKISRITGVAKDITERKEAEHRITHLNRVLAMLGGINALIVRVRDRDELFNGACKLAVEAGGFLMSWIGIVDPGSTSILPIASAGRDERLMAALDSLLSSAERAPGTLAARAVREKTAIVADDSVGDSMMLFGRRYTESGVRSMAVLPLIVADEAVGVLALYSSEIQFFHAEEMKLLRELAGDIAFAIDHLGKQGQLDYLAYYDELTGLANRRLFFERVAQYMRSAASDGHRLAVFLVDLERFKNINDSLGRPAGDALLRQVAEWLTSKAAGDVNLLARVGADHFALVMPEVRQAGDLTRLIEKWTESFLNHPFRLDDAVFRIAFKVGVALFPDDGADAETLFRNAEAALKKAKASVERYVLFNKTMTAAVAGKLTLENQLRQALDNQEFVLHYQPKVNLASGKLTGAEALIRWNDPRTGLVPPGRFIPVLEETGLIYDVGRWALRQAIADYLRWRAAGLPAVRIAVNVSPLQLRNRGFIDEIGRVIAIDEQAAAGLELEITESVIMEDVKYNIASLQAIRDLGISIAIDDFGTGFSSLAYLARLPVDTLKIDRSFVIDMTAGPQGLALVSTIIALAHSLKLKVVAEGVETEEQQHLLHLLDCDETQGFLFSKPLPAEIFEARFLASEARA